MFAPGRTGGDDPARRSGKSRARLGRSRCHVFFSAATRISPTIFVFSYHHLGCPPRGYKGTMKAMSEKYHKIWLDNPQLTDDYPAIMEAFT